MLQVIQGKPGSGKSYHCCKMVMRDLIDWCKYEQKTGEMFPRRIYTNLPFFPDQISARIEEWHKTGIDAAKYFHVLDMKDAWWESVPDDALIVVDEVHEHLGSENDRSYKELLKEFRNYIATHRHHGHDVIMITQHIDNVSLDILRIAERIVELQNFKAGRIPILGIDLADIDVVRKAFGSTAQFYRASFGRVVGRSIKYDQGASTHAITKDYFGLYDSHNKSDGSESGSGDRPSAILTRRGALFWFIGKHWKHLTFKTVAVVGLVSIFVVGVQKAPNLLQGLVKANMAGKPANADSKPDIKPDIKTAALSPSSAATADPVSAKSETPATNADAEILQKINDLKKQLKTLTDSNQLLKEQVARLKYQKRVVAVLPGAVLLADGQRIDVGGSVSFDGMKEESLKSVNVKTGEVVFSSGRIIWLR